MQISDPRPDLPTESAAWSKLLGLAYQLPEEDMDGVYGTLLGLRCLGASLVRDGTRWGIQRGEIPEAEYQAIRTEYLLPVKEKIMGLFGRLT
jgi:hypothetical protein